MTRVIDEIFALFHQYGDLHYGEDVTQLQHILQAAHLAQVDGADGALVAAALLHDIGQFMGDAGHAAEQRGVDAGHEFHGARWLSAYFPAEVTEPVRLHVAAKRYLCTTEPGYREALSQASAISLHLQGGPFVPEEGRAFEREPFWREAVRLRRYDDLGKRRDWPVPDLESYRSLLESLLRTDNPARLS